MHPLFPRVLQALRLAPLLLVCVAAACSSPPPPPLPPAIPLPDALLTCSGQPPAPDSLGLTDTTLALWITDTVDAGQDCRDKLGLIRGLSQSKGGTQ